MPQSGYGDVSDLMVPAGEHVLLVGSSHMRSIAELIMAAHRFSNDEPQKSDTRDSNDCMLNQTAAELKAWREFANSTGHIGQCGLFDRLWHGQQLAGQVDCKQSDFFTATFPSGGSLTIVANFAGWQLGDDEPSLLDRVGQDIDARKITHAIYTARTTTRPGFTEDAVRHTGLEPQSSRPQAKSATHTFEPCLGQKREARP